jgi:hypothetical protein
MDVKIAPSIVALAFSWLGGCFIGPIEEEGRACASTEPKCAPGYRCTETNLCVEGAEATFCRLDTDCTGNCEAEKCEDGKCAFVPDNTPAKAQRVYDCRIDLCQSGVAVSAFDDSDAWSDDNPCTTERCSEGEHLIEPAPAASACSGALVCDGAGRCVECLGTNPAVSDDRCTFGMRDRCDGGKCVTEGCVNGFIGGMEVQVDCGGICKPCEEACRVDTDCVSMSCVGETCTMDCTDGVKNGAESGIDCGGPGACPRCIEGSPCTEDTDCASPARCVGICFIDL